MKYLIKYSSILIILLSVWGIVACTEDDESQNLYPDVIADFEYNIDEEFITVQFLNNSQGAATYLWDFGNGTTSTEPNPTVAYDTFGTYTVTLTATGPQGETATQSYEIVINEYFYPLNFPIDFEDNQNDYTFTSFGGAEATRIQNPDASGINNSAYVVEVNKPTGAETWAGTTLEVENAIDFTTYNSIKIKTWSPIAGAVVMVKIEDSNNGDTFIEVSNITSLANAWEELIFTFPDTSQEDNFDKISIFFNFGVVGEGNTYYFDDMQLSQEEINPCVAEMQNNQIDPENAPIAITFSEGENPLDAFGNTAIEVAANPLVDDVNNSCQALKYTKNSAAEVWAGIAVAGGLESAFAPETQNGVISMKVLSTVRTANITIRMEFMPHPDVDPSVTITQPTTTIGEWEELQFDFSAHTDKTFKSMVIYVDEGVAGDDTVFYIDEIRQ